MKLVHTVERYAPQIGGAERVVQRLSEGLASRGHEVVVVTTGRRRSEVVNGVRVERFPVRGNAARGIRGNAVAALRLIEELAPDLVFSYAAQTWHADLLDPLAREPRSYRLVLAPCGFSALHDPRYEEYFARMRIRLSHYDALVFHSRAYLDWAFAVAANVPTTAMHVIPNAADDPAARQPRRGGETVFVTVGSHVRSKGHGDFIKAVQAVGTEIPVRGVVVAPSRHGIDFVRGCQPRCFLESMRPGGPVRFVDGARGGVVERVLAGADIFLFASRVECAPIAVLEAMAAGVPWISYDVGNVRGLTGGVVVDSLDDLTEAAARLARSPDERRRLGGDGQTTWQRRHRWPVVIDAYERLFLRLTRTELSDALTPAIG